MGLTVVQRKNLAQFVHDAMEMEESIYTLGKMEEEAQKQRDQIISEANTRWAEANEAKREAEKEKNFFTDSPEFIKPKMHPEKILPLTIKKFFIWLLPCAFATCIVLSIAISIMSEKGMEIETDKLVAWVWASAAIASLVIGIIMAIREVTSAYKNEKSGLEWKQKEYWKAKREAEQKLLRTRENVQQESENWQRAMNAAGLLEKQIDTIHRNRNEISARLSSLYSFGLIPPDYRQMDCVIMLNQIFRNGLADDMRGAILLYEERVRHGEIVRGMGTIARMLGRLSQEMSAVTSRLERINENVCSMSRNLQMHNDALLRSNGKLLEEMRSNRQATQELIEQTAIGNYTSEQLLKSQEKILYYQRLQNDGALPYVY